MTDDPIKRKLMERARANRESYQPKAVPTPPNYGVQAPRPSVMGLDQRFHQGASIQLIPNEYSVTRLKEIIIKFDRGQKELEVITKMEGHPIIYRGLYKLATFVGAKPLNFTSIYALFRHQQGNVHNMNSLLAGMVGHYGSQVQGIRTKLDNSVISSAESKWDKVKIENKILPPEIARYQKAVDKWETVAEDDTNPEHFSALQEVINCRRVCREVALQKTLAGIGNSHHTQSTKNLILQEHLFETYLGKATAMAFLTKCYQDTLDTNLIFWENSSELSKAIKAVSQGVRSLARFNSDLNNHYIDTIKEVNRIVQGHPGQNMIGRTNEGLQDLVHEIDTNPD